LDSEDLKAIARGVAARSNPCVRRNFTLFAAALGQLSIAIQDQPTMPIPRIG